MSSASLKKHQNWGWMRHVLTTLSSVLFMLGCIVIGYMAWVMATSTTVNRFLSGTLIFTYVVIGLGFFLFLNGLIGWVGSIVQSVWLLRLFLGASVICILTEIGGIITLNIVQIQMEDVVEHGWLELNQGTRNLVQTNMECCGFVGPQEFAYSTLPIDGSCYDTPSYPETSAAQTVVAAVNSNSNRKPVAAVSSATHFSEDELYDDDDDGDWTAASSVSASQSPGTVTPRLKQVGCGEKLHKWFEENKVAWVAGLATIGAVEFLAASVALFILRRLQTNARPRTLSRRRLRQHESDMANDPLPSELP